jgi:hypothetical protein
VTGTGRTHDPAPGSRPGPPMPRQAQRPDPPIKNVGRAGHEERRTRPHRPAITHRLTRKGASVPGFRHRCHGAASPSGDSGYPELSRSGQTGPRSRRAQNPAAPTRPGHLRGAGRRADRAGRPRRSGPRGSTGEAEAVQPGSGPGGAGASFESSSCWCSTPRARAALMIRIRCRISRRTLPTLVHRLQRHQAWDEGAVGPSCSDRATSIGPR